MHPEAPETKGRVAFKQADLRRAIKGAVSAGLSIGSLEITPDGRIIIRTGGETQSDDASAAFDKWLAGSQNVRTH